MAQGRKKIAEALKEKGFIYRDNLAGDGVHGTWRGASCGTGFVDVEVGKDFIKGYGFAKDEGRWQFLWGVGEGRKPVIEDGYLSELLECEMPWEAL